MIKIHHFIILCLLLLQVFPCHLQTDDRKVPVENNGAGSCNISISIGLIADMGSWVGKVVERSIKMSISDFYNLNNSSHTKVALVVRDSRGDSLQRIAAALDLFENVQVQAIIVPRISNKESILARLADEANVPLLSFSSISPIDEHPYFIQVAETETSQFRGISALLHAHKWSSFVFLYEDNSDARVDQTYIYEIFQENHLNVAHQTAISLMATADQIISALQKIIMIKSSIVAVHLSPSLASKVFINAKMLGMMSKGYAWIATSKTMNFLDFHDSSVFESMQGVLGFKSYIPVPRKLQALTFRLRSELEHGESNLEIGELSVVSLWAYDAAWLLTESIERAGIQLFQKHVEGSRPKQLDLVGLRVSNSGPSILSKIMSSNFTGLAGHFQLKNRKLARETYEILNVVGNVKSRVGFWTSAYGLTKELYPNDSYSSQGLGNIVWPGFSLVAPESWLAQMSGKRLRVGIPANRSFKELTGIYHDPQTNMSTPRGFCIDIFRAAIDRLPYNISAEYFPFYRQNGSYNDLVYQVKQQIFDAAVGDITILENRSAYVDFTMPFTEFGLGIVVKLDDKDPWFFLKPLDPDLWIASACFIVLTGFVVWLIEHRINEEFQGPWAQQIGTLLWFAVSTIFFAHREKLQSNVSRFVVGSWLFVVLVLTSSYTANLSSLLTVEQINRIKIDTVGGTASSAMRGIMKYNLNFTDDRIKLYKCPEEYHEALRKGSKRGGVDAITDEIPYLKVFIARYPGRYAIIGYSSTSSGFGFAFPKGSPLVNEISRSITGLREEGVIAKLEEKWFKTEPSLSSEDAPPAKFKTLGLDNFFGLFLISGLSNCVAVLVLLVFFLRERLSINYYNDQLLARGNLAFVLRLFFRRMAK